MATVVGVLAVAVLVVGGLLGPVGSRGVRAQDTPEFDGVTIEDFGGGRPAAAPGTVLGLRRITIEADATLPPYSNPGSVTMTVDSGELVYTLLRGEATLLRGQDGGAGDPEPMELNDETTLSPGDSVFVDDGIVTATNTGDDPVVIWVASLQGANAPFLVEEQIAPTATPTPESTSTPEATATSEPTSTPDPTATPEPTLTPTPEPETVRVFLDEFSITMSSEIPAGETTFEITNTGSVNHSFVIVGDGAQAVLDSPLAPGETAELTIDLPAGAYRIVCPVGNHNALGMSRDITVTDEGE